MFFSWPLPSPNLFALAAELLHAPALLERLVVLGAGDFGILLGSDSPLPLVLPSLRSWLRRKILPLLCSVLPTFISLSLPVGFSWRHKFPGSASPSEVLEDFVPYPCLSLLYLLSFLLPPGNLSSSGLKETFAAPIPQAPALGLAFPIPTRIPSLLEKYQGCALCFLAGLGILVSPPKRKDSGISKMLWLLAPLPVPCLFPACSLPAPFLFPA